MLCVCNAQCDAQNAKVTEIYLLLRSPHLNTGLLHITRGILFWHRKVNISRQPSRKSAATSSLLRQNIIRWHSVFMYLYGMLLLLNKNLAS